MSLQLWHVLSLSSLVFCLGLFTLMTRRNAIAVLMGVELILNAAGLNLVSFAHFGGHDAAGQVFSLFVIVLAAAEAAVALAIVVSIYKSFRNIDVSEATVLKG